MASVVLNADAGYDQLYASGVLAGGAGFQSATGSLSANTASVKNTIQVVAGTKATGATNATAYNLDNQGINGGGLAANHLQVFGYFDSTFTTSTIQEFADVYPTAVGGTAPATTTTGVWRSPNSVPLGNYVAPFIGTTTGNGATPVVVACAGIPASSQIRFTLQGGSAAAFAAGIAAPSVVSVQGNVSFTYTGTTGAIYGYEVLFA